MKLLPILLLATLALAAQAQDATNPPAASPPTLAADPSAANALQGLRGNLRISSLASEFDLKSNTVVYLGSVRVEATNMLLLCEALTSVLPAQGGRIDRVVARTNVNIDLTDEKGQKLHATAEQAVYTYTVTPGQTNESIELSGTPQPTLDNPQGTLTGDVITYDLATGRVRATNQRMLVRQDAPGLTNAPPPAAPGTNAEPATNSPPPKP